MGHNIFKGPLLLNGGYKKNSGNKAISDKGAHAVSFATSYIANPDLVKRLQDDRPLSEPKQEYMYTNTVEGYSDYTEHA